MGQDNKADLRRFPRFKVADLPILRARIDRGRQSEHIVTLGQGGCGFYGFDPKWPFNPSKRIFCELRFEGLVEDALSLESSIVYMKNIEVEGKKVVFYGVEFMPFEQKRVECVIKTLEQLRSEGKIQLA